MAAKTSSKRKTLIVAVPLTTSRRAVGQRAMTTQRVRLLVLVVLMLCRTLVDGCPATLSISLHWMFSYGLESVDVKCRGQNIHRKLKMLQRLFRRFRRCPLLRPYSTPSVPCSPSIPIRPEIQKTQPVANTPNTTIKDEKLKTILEQAANYSATHNERRLVIQFTCKQCTTRSTHHMSHHAYHHGTVMIECPQCRGRHLIADHLGIVEPGYGSVGRA